MGHDQAKKPDFGAVVLFLGPWPHGFILDRRYFLRFHSGLFEVHKEVPDVVQCLHNLPLVLLISAVAYRLTGQYAIHRFRRLREEFASVFRGVALMGLLVVATTFGLQDRYESRATFLLYVALTMVLILAARRCSWAAVRWLRRRGYNQTQSIIVGTGRVARKTARSLRVTAWLGVKNIGFVEDQPTLWSSDLDILGTPADLPRLIEKYQVSHVFICLPMNRYHETRRIYDILSHTYAEVRLIADVPQLAGLSLTTTNFDGMPMIGLRESPHFGFNVVFKRALDIVCRCGRARRAGTRDGPDRRAHQNQQSRPSLLPARTLRPQWLIFSNAQVS